MTEEVETKDLKAPKNIDSLIVQSQAPVQAVNEPSVEQDADVPRVTSVTEVEEKPQVEAETLQVDDEKDEEPVKSEKVDKKVEKVDKETSEEDEYGTPIATKKKMYTEEEVSQKIRERLARVKLDPPPVQQPVRQEAEGFTPDSNSDDSWEVQLENFIDKKLEKNQRQSQERQWQQEERQRQTEFEEKFNSGMEKYQDFKQVVAGKPITDSMMMAARSMKDPAAFIYAAAKTQAAELERIARIPDIYQQATEIGRLEERMKKARQGTKAGKIIRPIKGDMTEGKTSEKPSIDSLIQNHAKSKLRR